jgi:hypothetical protein
MASNVHLNCPRAGELWFPSDLRDISATTETVLVVIDAEQLDAVSFFGDLTGYGANPNGRTARIRDHGIAVRASQACRRERPGLWTSMRSTKTCRATWRMRVRRGHQIVRRICHS